MSKNFNKSYVRPQTAELLQSKSRQFQSLKEGTGKLKPLLSDSKQAVMIERLYSNTQEGLVLYDREGKIILTNPAVKRLLGLKGNTLGVSRNAIVRNRYKYFKYKHERSDNSLETQKKVLEEGKKVNNVLIKIFSRPYKYVEANYTPIKNSRGEVLGMAASFTDVTLLKIQSDRLSKQFRESQKHAERYRAIFNNVEEGVSMIDRYGKIISANSAFELMTNRSPQEIIGEYYYKITQCHNRLGHFFPDFDPISKVLSTKESIPYDEHLHYTRDGKERWVGVSYTPIFDDTGQIEQIVSVIRDITEIKNLEKAKNEFVSLASHELRTPLTVINGYLSLMLKGDLGDMSQEASRKAFFSALGKIYNETNRTIKLVEELLNVTRIEDGRLKLKLKKRNVWYLLSETINQLQPLAEAKNLDIELKRDGSTGLEESLSARVDEDKLKEVLVNLIDNAIKYTGNGGKVTAKCFANGKQVFIEIADTGVGIDPSVLPRIFEKFQQGSTSYLKENKGTGLGLYVVKSLVELHHGKIWVDSKIGKGSKFTLALPSDGHV